MTPEEARAELARLRASLPYAYACGNRLTLPDHPLYRELRAREALLMLMAGEQPRVPPPGEGGGEPRHS